VSLLHASVVIVKGISAN